MNYKMTRTSVLESINYMQLLLQNINETQFYSYMSYRQTAFESLHPNILNLLHQLNDNGVLCEEYVRQICNYIDIKGISQSNELIDYFQKKFNERDNAPLSFMEVQNYLLCIKFLAQDESIDIYGINTIYELIYTVRRIKDFN